MEYTKEVDSHDSTTESPIESTGLNIVDLQNIAKIIDAAVSRGAFRANEIAQVGNVYDKLESFLKSSQRT